MGGSREGVAHQMQLLDFSLLGNFQGVIHLNAKVPNGALQLGVPEKQLYGAQVLGTAIDQCGLGAA
jgi:hypothetical protein